MDTQDLTRRVRDLVWERRHPLRFCLRMTVAALAALALVQTFHFPLHGLWTVLTAVVVTQISIGGSLRATLEYMIGTLGGAIYAAAIGVLIPHTTAAAQALVLALAVAPLAFAAAINPSFRVAPFSAVLVLLIGGTIGESPIDSAVVRVIEVALGGAVAVVVSVLVFPARAEGLAIEAAGRILNQMAELLPKLLMGSTRTLDAAEIRQLQGRLGESVTAIDQMAVEARRERLVPLGRGPDPAPLSRISRRLRHDLVILGRAAVAPLPKVCADRLGPALDRLGPVASAFLLGSSAALAQGRSPPPLEPVEAALEAHESEIAALRKEGLTRPLSTAEAERLFALGFALEQLRGNFADLAQIVQERARGGGGRRGY
jgi:uncharacterized membrane protein YccC